MAKLEGCNANFTIGDCFLVNRGTNLGGKRLKAGVSLDIISIDPDVVMFGQVGEATESGVSLNIFTSQVQAGVLQRIAEAVPNVID